MATSSAPRQSPILPRDRDEIETLSARIGQELLSADALLIATGAGMGVASGFGTFRGKAASAWPPLERYPALGYHALCQPDWFEKPVSTTSIDSPNFAAAWWQWQWKAYSSVEPHNGYDILREWANRSPLGAFVFTSNIDGHHVRSGFGAERVYECHGSLMRMQCCQPCEPLRIWDTKPDQWSNMHLSKSGECVESASLPTCPDCGSLARPNVLMFNDTSWLYDHSSAQQDRFEAWAERVYGAAGSGSQDATEGEEEGGKKKKKLVILEIGAGTTVMTVRSQVNLELQRAARAGVEATLVRINPEEAEVPLSATARHISAPVAYSDHLLARINEYIGANYGYTESY